MTNNNTNSTSSSNQTNDEAMNNTANTIQLFQAILPKKVYTLHQDTNIDIIANILIKLTNNNTTTTTTTTTKDNLSTQTKDKNLNTYTPYLNIKKYLQANYESKIVPISSTSLNILAELLKCSSCGKYIDNDSFSCHNKLHRICTLCIADYEEDVCAVSDCQAKLIELDTFAKNLLRLFCTRCIFCKKFYQIGMLSYHLKQRPIAHNASRAKSAKGLSHMFGDTLKYPLIYQQQNYLAATATNPNTSNATATDIYQGFF